jgi:hypothetical protein
MISTLGGSPDRQIRIRKDPIKNANFKKPTGLASFEEALITK